MLTAFLRDVVIVCIYIQYLLCKIHHWLLLFYLPASYCSKYMDVLYTLALAGFQLFFMCFFFVLEHVLLIMENML